MSGGGQFPFGNNNGGQNNGAKQSFQSLSDIEDQRRRGLIESSGSAAPVSRSAVQNVTLGMDIILPLYFAVVEGRLFQVGTMSGMGNMALLLSLVLLGSAGLTAAGGSEGVRNVWMGSRALFYIFGIVAAGMYFQYASTWHGLNGGSNGIGEYFPMILAGLGLGLSYFNRKE